MRAFAKWLETHPDLPIGTVRIGVDGTVRISPAEVKIPVYGYQAAEIAGLYTLADAVGAEVDVTPAAYGGWDLDAAWQLGAVTVTASVCISNAAVAVRPAQGTHEHEPEATTPVAA
jgi:hypothetical protein